MINDKLSSPGVGQLAASVDMAVASEEPAVVMAEVSQEVSAEEAERRYQEAVQQYEEQVEAVKELRKELQGTFQKSQDTFEMQLSYIAAGALGLSVGFIKDIVIPIKESLFKWMLITGWLALIATLLINLISHIIAGRYAKKGVTETSNLEIYNPKNINRRSARVEWMNWTTVGTLTGGIVLIVLFIIINGLYDHPQKGSKQSAGDPVAVTAAKDTTVLLPAGGIIPVADSSKNKP